MLLIRAQIVGPSAGADMSRAAPFKFVRCAKCGALADVEKSIISWNQRDIELCKHPPIEKCPDMQAAIKGATVINPNSKSHRDLGR
jgi:hypothetical protein